jgi:hypothetical protein
MRTAYLCPLILALAGCGARVSAHDDSWFNVPGGTWVPEAREVAHMQVALDDKLSPILDKRADSTIPPRRYWFQYFGSGSGVEKTIEIVGYPFPVPSDAPRSFHGAVIPEQCHVFASYVPKEHRFTQLSVGGFYCPPRI